MTDRPHPTGEYAVGTFTFTVYNDREEVLVPGTMRSIPARVYYPVSRSSVEGMTKAKYMSKDMAKALRKYMHAPVNYEKIDAAGDNYSECYENAPVISGMRFPLIVFNHGLASFREANSFLCIDLASHGYVVIAAGHPYDAVLTEADDGTKTELSKEITKRQYEPFLPGAFSVLKLTYSKGTDRELADRFDEIQNKYCRFIQSRIDEWIKDTLAVTEYAKRELSGMIDLTNGIGVAGHSMGGAVAYLMCLEHDEFVCGANMDGALFGNTRGKIMRKPFAQLSCKTNHKAETRAYLDHTEVVYGALFRKMQHLGFSDMKYMIPLKAVVGRLDAGIAHENVLRIHLELFDTYLKRIKDTPDLKSNDFVTVTEYQPDSL